MFHLKTVWQDDLGKMPVYFNKRLEEIKRAKKSHKETGQVWITLYSSISIIFMSWDRMH